jgi:hypothetical protein
MLRIVAPYCLAVVGVLLVIAGVAGPVLAACNYQATACATRGCDDTTPTWSPGSDCHNPPGGFTTFKYKIDAVVALMTTVEFGGSYQRGQRGLCGAVNTWYCGDVIVSTVAGGACNTLVTGGGGYLATQVGC